MAFFPHGPASCYRVGGRPDRHEVGHRFDLSLSVWIFPSPFTTLPSAWISPSILSVVQGRCAVPYRLKIFWSIPLLALRTSIPVDLEHFLSIGRKAVCS